MRAWPTGKAPGFHPGHGGSTPPARSVCHEVPDQDRDEEGGPQVRLLFVLGGHSLSALCFTSPQEGGSRIGGRGGRGGFGGGVNVGTDGPGSQKGSPRGHFFALTGISPVNDFGFGPGGAALGLGAAADAEVLGAAELTGGGSAFRASSVLCMAALSS